VDEGREEETLCPASNNNSNFFEKQENYPLYNYPHVRSLFKLRHLSISFFALHTSLALPPTNMPPKPAEDTIPKAHWIEDETIALIDGLIANLVMAGSRQCGQASSHWSQQQIPTRPQRKTRPSAIPKSITYVTPPLPQSSEY
jgi:hypothetical protein